MTKPDEISREKQPKAVTRFVAIHLPTAGFLCADERVAGLPYRAYKLYGSAEKAQRGLKQLGAHNKFRVNTGEYLLSESRSYANRDEVARIIRQFDFLKAFTFIKFPNGDKILKVYITVPDLCVFIDSSLITRADLQYFKEHPERVIYENNL